MTLICLAISALPSLAWSMASSMYMPSRPAGLMKACALLLHPVVKASPAKPGRPGCGRCAVSGPAHIFPRSADDIVVRSQIYGNARWQVFQAVQCEMIIVLGVFDIEYESRESGEKIGAGL